MFGNRRCRLSRGESTRLILSSTRRFDQQQSTPTLGFVKNGHNFDLLPAMDHVMTTRPPQLSRTSATWLGLLGVCLFLACAASGTAGDWPGILGPERNGIADKDERIVNSLPEKLKPIWEHPVGPGVAGAIISQGRVFIFHRQGNNEVLDALAESDGHLLWSQSHATTFTASIGGEHGPLCPPTASLPATADQKIVVFGAQGVLECYQAEKGTRLWTHETHREFEAREGYFGAGSTPLIVGNRVVVNVGGKRKDAALVGFQLDSGKHVWKAIADDASYSAPLATTLEGQPAIIALTRLNCVALNPESGSINFQFPFGDRGPTVNAATPVMIDKEHLFLTASYGIGAVYAKVEFLSAQTLWKKDGLLSSQYTTPILDEGLLYGIHGRDDGPEADLNCLDFKAKQVVWSAQGIGYATLIKADGKLLIVKTNGELILARISPKKFDSLGRARLSEEPVRALPALAHGRLYVRNKSSLMCFDLSAK